MTPDLEPIPSSPASPDAALSPDAQRALRLSEERFRLICSVTIDALWDWDLRTDALWWSDGIRTLFGYASEELSPTIESWTTLIHPDEANSVVADVHHAIEQGDSWSCEYRFIRSDGEVVWVLDRARVQRDEHGTAIRMVGGMTDITDRRRAEDAVLREQRVESLGVLAGGMVHNLNNLLGPILLACDVLDDRNQSHEVLEAVDLIRSGSARAAELCQGLLSFARGTQGQRERIDLVSLVDETVGMLREVLPRSIVIDTHIGQPVAVRGDPAQLQQVVVNLCVNARDAMPEGGTVTVGAERFGSFARINISDTGVGIDEESMRQLWDPFFTTKEQGQGTGLGLPSSLSIVRSHAGTIEVHSEVGVGTRFEVYLPIVDDEPPACGEAAPPAPLAAAHVLVIDDEPLLRQAVCRLLERAGHRTSHAAGAYDGLAILADDPTVDVVVTDLMMPGVDGSSVLDQVSLMRPGLPTVLVSGAAPDDVLEAVGARPRVTFLTKPFCADELLAALQQAMQGAS